MKHPIEHYYTLIEEALAEYNFDPKTARGPQPGLWNLKFGSASIWADVFQSKDAQGNLTSVWVFPGPGSHM